MSDPEIIVIMPCGFGLERTKQESKVLTQHPALEKFTGGQER